MTGRNWIVQGSGQGYYALMDNIGVTFRVGPWSTTERAKAYISDHGDDDLEAIKLFQYQKFGIAQGNG